jgi:chromosome segregation ATPase
MKNRKLVYLTGFLLLAALITGPACATKKFVRTESATLDQKISGVSTEVEATQKRISEHDEKLATIGSLISKHDDQFKAVEGEIGEVKTLIKGNLVMTATLKNARSSSKRLIFTSISPMRVNKRCNTVAVASPRRTQVRASV